MSRKTKQAEIQERRKKVAELLRERKTFREILPEIGVSSLQTVHADVKAIFDEWREMRVTNVDDVMMTELSRLLWVIEEAQQQWEASKNRTRKKLKYRASKLDDTGKPKEGVKPDEFEVTTFHAERQYLETIVNASESLRKLLGVDSPEKYEGNINLTFLKIPDERENGKHNRLESARRASDGSDDD